MHAPEDEEGDSHLLKAQRSRAVSMATPERVWGKSG